MCCLRIQEIKYVPLSLLFERRRYRSWVKNCSLRRSLSEQPEAANTSWKRKWTDWTRTTRDVRKCREDCRPTRTSESRRTCSSSSKWRGWQVPCRSDLQHIGLPFTSVTPGAGRCVQQQPHDTSPKHHVGERLGSSYSNATFLSWNMIKIEMRDMETLLDFSSTDKKIKPQECIINVIY